MKSSALERNWNVIPLITMLAGSALVILGVIANPFVIERFISTDGHIEEITFRNILFLDGILVIMGLMLFFLSRTLKTYSERKGKLISNFLTFCGSLVFTLILLELGLHFVNKFIKPFNRQRHAFFEYHEKFGWKHKANKTAFFKNTKVVINSNGLRDREVAFEKPKGEFRILCLGDSQLFGDGIPEEETFVSLLESRFKSIQAINTGVIGYGNDQQLLYLQEEGIRYNPDIVMVTLNGYDFLDNISKTIRSGYSKPVFELEGEEIRVTNIPVPKFDIVERVHRGLKNLSHLYYYGNIGLVAFRHRNSTAPNPGNELRDILPKKQYLGTSISITKRILRQITRVSKENNAKTIVVYLPYILDFEEDNSYKKQVAKICETIKAYGKENDFYFLDIRSELLEQPNKNIFLDKVHLNKDGHKLVEEIISDFLLNQKLLP